MCTYIYVLEFLAFQFIEYFAHKALHRCKITRHLQHHQDKSLDSPFFLVLAFYLAIMGRYGLVGGIATYLVVHRLVHLHPTSLPMLARHHQLHHEMPTVNFGVTSPLCDIIFGTIRT